jgi:hypothetical protein
MTQTIKEQILAIRDTGLTNMFDIPWCSGSPTSVTSTNWCFYLEEHRKEYVNFILYRRGIKYTIPAVDIPLISGTYISRK